MIKPKALHKGDTVAIVSLSSGMGGDALVRYRYLIGKQRLETVFGLNVMTMSNALKGSEYVSSHPEKRAEDLMNAFRDHSVKAIICLIGGDDTIRLLPYIDYDVIKNNPKIFMGYSDTTVNHFMMYKAGLVSFHGPCVLVEFAENVKMHDYTTRSIYQTLFEPTNHINITPSPVWTSEFLDWTNEKNQGIQRKLISDLHGYEVLQGSGTFRGRLIGGCLAVLKMIIGTELWPDVTEWKDKILFLETGEDYPTPSEVCYFLRNLVAQGIMKQLKGLVVGKPLDERYYEEYKAVYRLVIDTEAGCSNIPILYNVNCSHTSPSCILPYGLMAEINCNSKSFSIVENAVVE